MGESKRYVKNKTKVEGSICVNTCIVRPYTFALTILKTSRCHQAIIGMKHNGKVKHLSQHYQCFNKLVITQARSPLIG